VSWPTNAAFWLPFEAAYTNNANRVVLPDPLPDMPPVPAIPCGLRIWGGPIPTLESWQRLLREAKKMNINSVIVQSGGWVDMRNPEILYPAMLDLAQAEGIYVTMYVGNETAKSHYPVAWTNSNHTRIITAIKNHPALLHFALYNQLTRLENMTADEIQTLDGQIAYLSTNTDKSIDVEVCGDQNNHEFAAEKIALMEHLRDRGVKIISTDVAPVGGWSATHDHTIWETRIERILDLGLTPMCCIQAHIPFEGPAIPAEADVFLQFWLNVAAGTRGFYYEAAYVYNHYSIRGLLSWKLKPLPDGRAGAAAATMGYLPALTNMLVNSQKVDDPVSASALTIETANPDNVLMRMRTDGIRSWLFLINRDTANPVEFTLKRTVAESLYLREVAPGSSSRLITETGDRLSLPPGQGVCFEMD
jgi:sugar phosphate isomerase/epimerase